MNGGTAWTRQTGVMKRIEVVLIGWEHDCCGPRRAVGDEVSMKVYRSKNGDLYEDRHGQVPGLNISGRLKAMELRPNIHSELGNKVIGYGPGTQYESTEAAGDAIAGAFTDFALAFRVETGDPLPD